MSIDIIALCEKEAIKLEQEAARMRAFGNKCSWCHQLRTHPCESLDCPWVPRKQEVQPDACVHAKAT
jgi:hypothetical protein